MESPEGEYTSEVVQALKLGAISVRCGTLKLDGMQYKHALRVALRGQIPEMTLVPSSECRDSTKQ